MFATSSSHDPSSPTDKTPLYVTGNEAKLWPSNTSSLTITEQQRRTVSRRARSEHAVRRSASSSGGGICAHRLADDPVGDGAGNSERVAGHRGPAGGVGTATAGRGRVRSRGLFDAPGRAGYALDQSIGTGPYRAR